MDASEGQLEVQGTASEIYHRVNKKSFTNFFVNVLGGAKSSEIAWIKQSRACLSGWLHGGQDSCN